MANGAGNTSFRLVGEPGKEVSAGILSQNVDSVALVGSSNGGLYSLNEAGPSFYSRYAKALTDLAEIVSAT